MQKSIGVRTEPLGTPDVPGVGEKRTDSDKIITETILNAIREKVSKPG